MKRILLSLVLILATSPLGSIATAADPITIAYSNITIDKSSVGTGQSINVTFDMRSTGLPNGLQPSVFLEIADQSSECEEECGSSIVKQVSGNLAQGKWTANITVGSGLPSGVYRVVIFFPKLKGVKGALYYDNRNLILTNTSTPKKPSADPITIAYSNVTVDKTAISTGQSINVTFDMRSTGLPIGLQPSVFLEIADQSSECEEECGSSVVKQISGTMNQGKWTANVTVGSGLPSGVYCVVIFIAKLKGVSGALYYDTRNLTLTNTSVTTKPSADPGKKTPTESATSTPKPTQSQASTSKLITITCVNGKLSKKVTAVKPVCPAGYKNNSTPSVQHEILIDSFQWSWQFTHLDASKDVKVTGTSEKPPTLTIPLGELVRFTVNSSDVAHGFWIPEFMIQIEARPGLTGRQEFTANKLGNFVGRCNILCGRNHSQMLFTVRVVTAAEYRTYIANLKLEVGKAAPTIAATPGVTVTPSATPSATKSVTPTPTPTPTPTATTTTTVSPGAFCSPAGATGKSTSGVSYTCKTSPTDTRNRWRQ
jgi:heme/copper-type cytochrome/quinol oxidase subunit 2